MKRSAKVCWVGFVFSTIVLAAVTGLVVYFTAFKQGITGSGTASFPIGGTTSANGGTSSTPDNPSDGDPSSGDDSSSSAPLPPPSGAVESLADHLSHSVPGPFEYREVDYDGDGFAMVQLDGSRSHTHYYDEGPPIVVGKIVEMTWFNNQTRDKIASGPKPLVSFPQGSTVVGLTVADNFRDSHTDYTTVIVEKPFTDGAYCYYYLASNQGFSIADDPSEGEKPIYAAPAPEGINFQDDSAFPSQFRGKEFQVRCVFFVGPGQRTFEVEHFGPVRMLVDGEVALESETEDLATTEGQVSLDEGQHTVQLLYSRVNSAGAKLELKEGGDGIQYDISAVWPVLTGIDPPNSALEGGGSVKITGIGLLNGVSIQFGGEELEVDVDTATDSNVFVKVPSSDAEQSVDVIAKNKAGSSNALKFTYASNGLRPIKFKESRVTMDGKTFDEGPITGIKYGPDHRYYLSVKNSKVMSFAANSEMKASDLCVSPSLGQHRDILGLAFNPADTEVKLYVSASVLYWKEHEKLTGPDAWANGQILLVMKDVDGQCLNKVGDPVVSGLPVSNHDHGLNGLVFDDEGNLHIQVGGNTNAGYDDGNEALGGIPETALSGASLIAPVSKSGFNGNIKYSSTDPLTAVVTGGDVSIFSPGWRNSFGIEFHSNGFLYATDNGPSKPFGAKSVSCTEHEDLPDKSVDDKLCKVLEGKYVGHPNRNRGRKDARQCRYRLLSEPSDSFYQAPVATFESSTDGVVEYTANSFNGQLKGNLFCSKFSTDESPGRLYRVQLNEGGDLGAGPDEMWPSSGLSIMMSPWGHILMPRIYKNEIIALNPDYSKGTIPMLMAVMPFRGSVKGGNRVLVTGDNFGPDPVALFDGKECTDVSVESDGRSFMCTVPAGEPGKGVAVSLRFGDGQEVESTGGVDYRYMKI